MHPRSCLPGCCLCLVFLDRLSQSHVPVYCRFLCCTWSCLPVHCRCFAGLQCLVFQLLHLPPALSTYWSCKLQVVTLLFQTCEGLVPNTSFSGTRTDKMCMPSPHLSARKGTKYSLTEFNHNFHLEWLRHSYILQISNNTKLNRSASFCSKNSIHLTPWSHTPRVPGRVQKSHPAQVPDLSSERGSLPGWILNPNLSATCCIPQVDPQAADKCSSRR